jgi:hypothetical protein
MSDEDLDDRADGEDAKPKKKKRKRKEVDDSRELVAEIPSFVDGVIASARLTFLRTMRGLKIRIAGIATLVVALGLFYIVRYFGRAPEPLNAITINILNFGFLMAGVLLHKTPARLMHAVQAATPAVWGVILQFPFYAGIAAIITTTHLNEKLAHAFVSISSPGSFPAVVAMYSAVLGVFVPSGGSKWVIEAPYVMAAAHELKVHLGWVVAAYDLGEALAARDTEARCGLAIFDLHTGDMTGWVRIEGAIRELYDVAFLPGVRRPSAVGFKTDDVKRVISIEHPA